MPLVLTNTLTNKKEIFQPLDPKSVRMYVCGPTVYGLTHVGNARPALFFSVLRNYLEFLGYKVEYISNYTDVDDRIINRAREEKRDCFELAEHFTNEYIDDMKALGIRPPSATPRVTTHMDDIIQCIDRLIKADAAYVAPDGEVFFSVRKFSDYGKLSKKNVDDLIAGARVATDEKKKDPLDFSLWKPQKTSDEPAWESPWGKGRPGWHIECTAMALKYLGESFDIHGGGLDLIHPHHENEIAQTEAMTKKPFVRYWLHCNLITTNSEKMSKSIGNIFFNRDFIKKYGAETLRFLLLSSHYRSPIDFSPQHIRDCQAGLHRVYSCMAKAAKQSISAPVKTPPSSEENALTSFSEGFKASWAEAMDDDLNTAKVVGFVFDYVRLMNTYLDHKKFKVTNQTEKIIETFKTQLAELSSIIQLFGERPDEMLQLIRSLCLDERGLQAAEIEKQIALRREARAKKDFVTADQIRKSLEDKGIELRDSANETEWDVSF